MTILAVIPARGGSKGVPRKNLRAVGGKSLLQRAIESASSSLIDRVLVSTDDTEIQRVAQNWGAEVPFLRPKNLATDFTSSIDSVQNAVSSFEKWSKESISIIVILEPTSPFRNSYHVSQAVDQFVSNSINSLVSVCPLERKPENIFLKETFLRKYIQLPNDNFTRRQDMSHLCRINSAIYIVRKETLFENNKIINEPIGWIEMNHEESLNIDSEIDLELAELLVHKETELLS